MTKEGRMKQQLLEKWKLEEKCFEDAVMKDVHGKEFKWPRNKPTEQITFERYFLDRVVDPESGHYYPKRDKDGLPLKTPDNPRYVVNTIIRIKRVDNTEFLVSKGNLISYDGLGDDVSPEPNINDTFKRFLKPFTYLYNAEYMTPEMKAQFRQEAIDAGFLTPPTTTTATTAPPKGTYS